MKEDYYWLEPWLPDLKNTKMLELGCGEGIDTRYVSDHTQSIVACDLDPPKGAGVDFPVMQLDHGKKLPFHDQEFDAVLASLTLHYFDWPVTMAIVTEISRVLKDGGLLVCRLNSINDVNYGATGYPEIEPGLYNVDGQPKRFFREAEIRSVFTDGWRLTALQEKSIDRYESNKKIWEFGATKTNPGCN